MEDAVRKELDTLEQMVINWKESYLNMATPEGGDEYLADELRSEVTEYISPFVRRLFECKYLTSMEASEFLERCYGHVEELRQLLKRPEPEPEAEFAFKVVWQKVTRIFRPEK
ncbi:MAG: hypothetical protein JRI59_00645 [Deltaproteobacteria bacterium]|nr:hypothetical protein [Deltaproteobacteria bacterium]